MRRLPHFRAVAFITLAAMVLTGCTTTSLGECTVPADSASYATQHHHVYVRVRGGYRHEFQEWTIAAVDPAHMNIFGLERA